VRAIQIQGKPAEAAVAGQRCALNLSGADLESASRGDWVLDPAIHSPTQRLDVRISVLAAETKPLKHWTPVHLHLATADVTARVAIRSGAVIAPGSSALAQLLLDHPVGALHGDRFILRDQSASRTLGGGSVLNPFAPPTRRNSSARLAELGALERPTPETTLAELIKLSEQGVDLARFEKTFNLTPERAAALYAQADLVHLGRESRIGIARARHTALHESIVESLARFHRAQPQAAGEDMETLRHALAPHLATEAFQSLLRELADARRIEVGGSTARLPGHNTTSNSADEKLWQSLLPALETAGFTQLPVRDLAAQLKLKEAIVKDFLHRKAKSGEVLKVTADRFYPRATLATLAAIAQATAQARPDGLFTAAQYRDATGISRGLAINILEFLDTLGITQRIGDARKMRKDFAPILGPATVPEKIPEKVATSAKAAPPAQRPAPRTRR
jgi:selenocysteine-specific elongation factor